MTSAAAESEAMIKLPKLSIAAVNGMAIGGGVNLALVWQDFVPGLWLSNSPGLAPNVFSLHLSSELRSTSARTAHRFGIYPESCLEMRYLEERVAGSKHACFSCFLPGVRTEGCSISLSVRRAGADTRAGLVRVAAPLLHGTFRILGFLILGPLLFRVLY